MDRQILQPISSACNPYKSWTVGDAGPYKRIIENSSPKAFPYYGDSRKRRRVLLCVASQNIGVPSFREAEEVWSIAKHDLFRLDCGWKPCQSTFPKGEGFYRGASPSPSRNVLNHHLSLKFFAKLFFKKAGSFFAYFLFTYGYTKCPQVSSFSCKFLCLLSFQRK